MTELLRELYEACVSDALVMLSVTDCLYACCARPPSRRAGYLQVYRGVIAAVDERKVILHSLALNSLNYHVIAALENVQDVTAIET